MILPTLAILLLCTIIGCNRLNAEIYTKRAIINFHSDRWNDVIYEIDHAVSKFRDMDHSSTPLLYYKGGANFSLKNLNQALKDFKIAYEVNPHHIHLLNNLATCYELLGDHENAILYYQKALKISPRFNEALINLGVVYYNIGNYPEAYKLFLQCNQNSNNQRLHAYLQEVKKILNLEE